MGNKDSRGREAKKPKKKEPKLAPPRRSSDQITTKINSTPNYPVKNPTDT